MRKAITFILTAVLVMAMALPAAAASPTAPASSEEKTAALPVIVKSSPDCKYLSIFDADTLDEEAREAFIAAQESLKEATPDGMVVKYLFYHVHVSVESCNDVFDIGEFEEAVVKQYVAGEWTERKVTVNTDGTITVEGLVEGPVAIFTK